MGFFEKLTNTINSTGKEVEQKAKMVSGTVKLNGQIKEMKEAIQESMRQVGELYYKKQEGISDEEEFAVLFEKIRKNRQEIADAERKIETLKGIYRCKNCGAEMRMTDNYCMMCGTKKEDAAEMIEEATVDAEAVVTDIDEQKEEVEIDFEEADLEQEEEILEETQQAEEDADAAQDAEEIEEEEGIDPSEFEGGTVESEKKPQGEDPEEKSESGEKAE